MPQSNEVLHDYDLRGDMRNYYRGSVVTYVDRSDPLVEERYAALVEDFGGGHSDLRATIRVLPKVSGGWSSLKTVPVSDLEFTLPHLGLIRYVDMWFHLSRHPARRMRKGYHPETVQTSYLDGIDYPHGADIMETSIIRQVWYGNPDRISPTVIIIGTDVFFTTDKVASLDTEGNVNLIPNKEKLGEFACKALANNWELATSKHSVRTLPSSRQMPLV